jgi:hypothetical protein
MYNPVIQIQVLGDTYLNSLYFKNVVGAKSISSKPHIYTPMHKEKGRDTLKWIGPFFRCVVN